MKRHIWEVVILAAGLAALVAFALLSQQAPVSIYSTYDTGPNGYEALFNVLRSEGVDVDRLTVPFAQRDSKIRTVAFTSTFPEDRAGHGLIYDSNDYKRLAAFVKSGGSLVYFASPSGDPMRAAIKKQKLHVTVLDATKYTNLALSRDPAAIARVYTVFAQTGGPIAFDERLHGFATDRSMWSVLSWPVRAAVWIVFLALAIVLVDANVRFAPAIVREPPPDRDSATYIASMAALLRRAGAGRAAVARFAKSDADNGELQELALRSRPNDATVLRAAVLASHKRKEVV
jgi:hypothetical protein